MSAKANLGHGLFAATLTRGPRAGRTAYYGRVWIKSEGRVRYFTLKKTTEREARKELGGLGLDPERAIREREARKVESLTVGDVMERFLAGYKSRGGTGYYASILRAPREHFGDGPVDAVTPQALDSYLRKRRAERTKPVFRIIDRQRTLIRPARPRVGESSLKKEIIALGTLFKWARRRGFVAVNVLADYERPKEPGHKVGHPWTRDEEGAILALLPPLERDFLTWALDSGMRLREILALAWPNIDRVRGVVHVIGTKTDRARILPLSLSERLPAILDRHPRRIGCELLFHDTEGQALDVDKLNRALRAAIKGAGIERSRGSLWNIARKTFSSRLYAGGRVMPQDEAAWAGHSIAIAMRHYVEYSPAAHERAAGALDVVPAPTVPPTVPRAGNGDSERDGIERKSLTIGALGA
jgi:integrase